MKSFLIFLFIALFQNASAQITVTMRHPSNQPMVGETISFASEQKEVLASCMTNISGRCTMILEDPPTQGNGLIRGTLITEHGQRPIIFKGELFEISLTLDEEGKLPIPSDLYVTRTPQSSPIPETTARRETTATTTRSPETTATTTRSPETTATTTTQPEATATTTTQVDTTAPASEENNLYFWLQLGLIIILIAAVMLTIWASQKQDNS